MTDAERLHEDLSFVRRAVDRPAPAGPATIYWLWAAICLVGIALPDHSPRHVPLFWSIAGPTGWLVSLVLGYRHSRRVGQLDGREGLRHFAHWGILLGAVGIVLLLAHRGLVAPAGVGPVSLLLVGVTYLLAGLHLDRLLLLPGALMVAGVFVLLSRDSWTLVAGLVAFGLACAGVVASRPRDGEGEHVRG